MGFRVVLRRSGNVAFLLSKNPESFIGNCHPRMLVADARSQDFNRSLVISFGVRTAPQHPMQRAAIVEHHRDIRVGRAIVAGRVAQGLFVGLERFGCSSQVTKEDRKNVVRQR